MSDQVLDEYQAALLAAQNPDYFLPEMWCADGANSIDYIIPPVTTADPKTASLSTGAPPLQQIKPIDGGAEFPRPEYNGILRLVSSIVAFLNKGSEFTFDVNNTAGYSANSVLYDYASKRYVVSLHDANTANFVTNPTLINGTDWQYLDVYLPSATTLIAGIIQLATQAEVNTATISNKAVVPSTLAGALNSGLLSAAFKDLASPYMSVGATANLSPGFQVTQAVSYANLKTTPCIYAGQANLVFEIGVSTATYQNAITFDPAVPGSRPMINNLGGVYQPAKAIATLGDITAVVPIGSIFTFAMQNPPAGFLVCNGAALSTATYSSLYAAIGNTYGGDTNTFNLPDLRGQFVRGWDNGRGVDTGRVFGSSQDSLFKSHNHGVNDPGHGHSVNGTQSQGANPVVSLGSINGGALNIVNANVTGISIQDTGGSETRPVNVALLYCIKF